jgi:hypothetical protein
MMPRSLEGDSKETMTRMKIPQKKMGPGHPKQIAAMQEDKTQDNLYLRNQR